MQKELIKTILRLTNELEEYKECLIKAQNQIEEAIHHIKYRSNLIDQNTGKTINEELINKLQNVIYLLEDYEDECIFKPYESYR